MGQVKKIIIHMGFHKTGTTSLQAYLHDYREALEPYCKTYTTAQLGKATYRGRLYGQAPTLLRRYFFRHSVRKLASKINGKETILISRESFSGIMVGQKQFGIFPLKRMGKNAAILAKIVDQEFFKIFGQSVEIIMVYTVREKDSWLKSVWGHVLRTADLTLEKDNFVNKYNDMPDLEDEVHYIQQYVKHAQVISRRLEDYENHPAGPAGAVLELLDLPDDFAEKNPSQSINYVAEPTEIQQKYLDLNRKVKDKKALKLQKAKIADEVHIARGGKPNRARRLMRKKKLF